MKTYEEMEYSNVCMQLEHFHIHGLIEQVVEAGFSVAWKENRRYFTLSIQTGWTTQRLTFDKHGKWYKLRNKSYQVKERKLSEILQKFIHEVKGHAVLKYFTNDQLVVQNIRYGEPIRIIEIKGPLKKVVFEKECMVTTEQVLEAFKRKDAEERIPVVKLEVDYALASLFEAIQLNDQQRIDQCKEELERLRIEMVLLEI